MLAWLTKNSIPSGRVEYVLSLPDDETWRADFLGALFLLTQPQNWELDQGLTPDEMADEWEKVFYDFNEGVYNLIPIGCYMPFAGSSAPGGWLICDGQAISRVTYAALFSVIGVAFGVGNGSTTFNIPNLKGKIPVGLDSAQTEFDALGESGGSKTHTLSTGELASHNHTQDTHNHTQNTHNHTQDTHNHTQNTHNHTQDTHNHSNTSHNHTQNAHNHTQDPHNHFATFTNQAPAGTGRSIISNPAAVIQAVDNTTATNQPTTPTNIATTISIGFQVATNQTAVATNQTTVATNQTTVATNQTTVATNQNTGGGGSHNNLQPYLVSNYIIKY